MARFYSEIQGHRGVASRLGSADSGIRAQCQGWNVGVKVYGRDDNGSDVFDIWATGGSHDSSGRILLGSVRLSDDGHPAFFPAVASGIIREEGVSEILERLQAIANATGADGYLEPAHTRFARLQLALDSLGYPSPAS
jgi:hypothetical protein